MIGLISVIILLTFSFGVSTYLKTSKDHPNIVILIVEDLKWNEIGYHTITRDTENASPNLDTLAYSGIIFNRFYANGGFKSLITGQYERPSAISTNLLRKYFSRNGYKIDFHVVETHDEMEELEQEISDNMFPTFTPFLMMIRFVSNYDRISVNVQNIDELASLLVQQLNKWNELNNTIILFASIDKSSKTEALESVIRRVGFIYSPLLKAQHLVTSNLFHITDILPTLVTAAKIQLSKEEWDSLEGYDQWNSLNNNTKTRTEIYGENFYLNADWKIAFSSNIIYDSIKNTEFKSKNREPNVTLRAVYLNSILNSNVHQIVPYLTPNMILTLNKRTRVMCSNQVSDYVELLCSQRNPCMFDIYHDSCEVDNYSNENIYKSERDEVIHKLQKFLRGDPVKPRSLVEVDEVITDEIFDKPPAGWKIGLVLVVIVFLSIFTLIVVVCVKEKCNTKRSVYNCNNSMEKCVESDNVVKVTTESTSRMPISTISDKI